MKKYNKKRICFLTTFMLLFTYISMLYSSVEIYAQESKSYVVVSNSSGTKPKSGSFKPSKSGTFSTKPKSTILKPDSGSFSTKPNTNSDSNAKKPSGSSIKPDSGKFSTTNPNTNDNSNNTDKNSSSGSYKDYGGNRSSRPIFSSRGFYGYSNPFYGMMYGFRTSSWITKLVVIITIIIIVYIVIDFIRNRRR